MFARHRLVMSFGLLLLAPTVGEFLLGNVPVSQYASVLVLVPLYGAGALLAREAARRLGAGWATIALFAAAYALVEEALVDQMVFNPGYLGYDSFAGYAEIPGLRISGTLVLWSLALHTVWSICVPIALVEAFDPTPEQAWLGRTGFVVTGVGFVAGCVLLGVVQALDLDFVGTPAQFTVSSVVILALVAGGVLAARGAGPGPDPRKAPRPVVAGAAALALTSAYWLSNGLPGGIAVSLLCWLLAVVAGVLVVRRWSARTGWGPRHHLALTAGAAATYGLWFGPSQAAEAGTGGEETVVGAVVFGLAIALVALAGRRSLRIRA